MSNFDSEIKAVFIEEAVQLLEDAEGSFLELERNPDDASLLDKIFRLAHNLKGSANAVGFVDVGALTHDLESLLLKLKSGEKKVTQREVNLLLQCNDRLSTMISTLREDHNARFDCSDIISEIRDSLNASDEPEPSFLNEVPSADNSEFEDEESVSSAPTLEVVQPENAEPALMPSEVKTLTADELKRFQMATAGDVIFDDDSLAAFKTEKSGPSQQATKESSAASNESSKATSPAAKKQQEATQSAKPVEEFIRVSSQRLDKLLNYVGELVILQTVLAEQSHSNNMEMKKITHQIGKVTKEIQEISMSLRMVPLKQTFQKLQRIVRDTSSALGKKINFVVTGEDVELDKTVLESLSDPLVHMVRNSVDHGVESAEKRKASGKSEIGNVELNAYQRGDKLILDLHDDGGGINPDVVYAKAVEKGIIKPGTKLSKKESINLIFAPGFSTKSEITDVSGRGVGMDVVKTNIEKIHGDVQIESEVGQGSHFKITLPLSLAIIDGIIIHSSGHRYVVPLLSVHEGININPADVQHNIGLGESIILRDESIKVVRLSKILHSKSTAQNAAETVGLVVRQTEQPFCVLIDEIIGQHQIVIKKLGKEMPQVPGIAGSAILGDGHPALILDLVDMVSQIKQSPVARSA